MKSLIPGSEKLSRDGRSRQRLPQAGSKPYPAMPEKKLSGLAIFYRPKLAK
jgi:hypothetical protein